MLSVQYRVNDLIMKFASDELYESRLSSAEGVKGHTLADLKARRAAANANNEEAAKQPKVSELDDLSKYPLILVDTAGLDMHELGSQFRYSRFGSLFLFGYHPLSSIYFFQTM